MFEGSFQWVSKVFERSSKRFAGKFQMCFKGVSRKIKLSLMWGLLVESFKCVSRMFQGSFMGVPSDLQL